MECLVQESCGGCKYRNMDEKSYRNLKVEKVKKVLSSLTTYSYSMNEPIFIADGCRRRASFAFVYKKGNLTLGFNKESSKEIINIKQCPLVAQRINNVLPSVQLFLQEFCSEIYTEKQGKKLISKNITFGDIFVCEADNGLDIVLEVSSKLSLSHKMIISDFCNKEESVIRVSHRYTATDEAETIVEKTKPFIRIGRYNVELPAGTFLQPSREGQEALGKLVLQGLKGITGKIADLFCGVGTFSYLLTDLPAVKIMATDSSKQLLKGFQDSINHNQIPNIDILQRNLFKYPLTEDELKEYSALVFDPPRAGAAAVCQKLASAKYKLEKIIAVSCNPATFVNDANKLISGGYSLQEVTIVDQFIYSDHNELVACFTKA